MEATVTKQKINNNIIKYLNVWQDKYIFKTLLQQRKLPAAQGTWGQLVINLKTALLSIFNKWSNVRKIEQYKFR